MSVDSCPYWTEWNLPLTSRRKQMFKQWYAFQTAFLHREKNLPGEYTLTSFTLQCWLQPCKRQTYWQVRRLKWGAPLWGRDFGGVIYFLMPTFDICRQNKTNHHSRWLWVGNQLLKDFYVFMVCHFLVFAAIGKLKTTVAFQMSHFTPADRCPAYA